MTIDERARHRLHERLGEVLGPEEAAILMEQLPPVGWADVATKQDLESLRFATKQDIEHLRAEMKGGFAQVEARMGAELHALESRLLRSMLVANSLSAATVGALAFAAAKLV
jgi:hypothetical protein